jgi:hypothetical protein
VTVIMIVIMKVQITVMLILQKFGKTGGTLYGENGEKNPGSCV